MHSTRRVETRPRIANAETQNAIAALKPHLDVRCAAVLGGVAQSFLKNAEQAKRDVPRQTVGDLGTREIDLEAVLCRELATEPAHRRHEAQCLELRRMQSVGEGV